MKIGFMLSFALITIAVATRVRMNDVKHLVFRDGKLTESRRTSRIPQMQCIGGCYKGFQPDTIHCGNIGSDGMNPVWKCKTNMPYKYKITDVDINCEGYDYPDDPYILHGSCAIRYRLTNMGATNDDATLSLLFVATAILTIYLLWLSCKRSNTFIEGYTSRTDNYSRPPSTNPYANQGQHVPQRETCQPPSYTYSTSSSQSTNTSSRLWDFTTGGLVGYLAGTSVRGRGSRRGRTRQRSEDPDPDDTENLNETTTSYATTSRR
jgi:hypothetical protein